MVPDEEKTDAESPTEHSETVPESGPGEATTGGTGGESEPEPEAAEEGGQEVPESTGSEENPPAETPAPEEVNGEGPTTPSPTVPPAPPTVPSVSASGTDAGSAAGSDKPADPTTPPAPDEQPAAGLPTEPESNESEDDGSPDDESITEELTELGGEALDTAKAIARGTLKAALVESRDYIKDVLDNRTMTAAEKNEVERLYRAAEKHALMGKLGVAHAMGKRLDNFVKSSSKVRSSQKARASQNYLTGLLRLATGAVSTFFATFGTPLVDKLTDIGLKATDEFLQ